MQIGAFAHLCDTKLSVLRHYDKEGILMPAYVDPITGYRHYTPEQADVFRRITALKRAGFSLAEIRRVHSLMDSDDAVLSLFDDKETQLRRMLADLSQARDMMNRERMRLQMTLTEENGAIKALSAGFDASKTAEMKREMDEELSCGGYQRISGFTAKTDRKTGESRLSCTVCRLNQTPVSVFEDIELPFVDDPMVIGRWGVVGTYVHRDDITEIPAASRIDEEEKEELKELYFLPGGTPYWCYGWTKGKLLCRFGDASYVCPYTIQTVDGVRYMYVEWKSYAYRCGGNPEVLLLRQLDNAVYSADMLARKDNIDLPFTDDPDVLGTWKAIGMVSIPDAFDPSSPVRQNLFFSRVTFSEGGILESVYGDRIISGESMQTWTRGYVLRKWNSTACAYEIRVIDDRPYLFIEWKSGDYIWGGREPHQYVFVRDTNP